MRKRFKIPLYGLVTIILLIAGALVLLFRSHLLESWANRLLAKRIASQYNLDITIGEIEGSFVQGFVLQDVTVRFFPGTDTVTLAHFPAIAINYQMSNLWHRRWIVDSMRFHRPQMFLARGDNGRWVLPTVHGGSGKGAEPPNWEIRRLAIDSASLQLTFPTDTLRWYDIDLDAVVRSEQGTYTVAIDTLRFNSEDGRLRIRRASGRATYGDRNLLLQDVSLTGDSTRAAFSLLLEGGDSARTQIMIDSARIHLPDIVSFLGSPLTGDLDLAGAIWRHQGITGGELLTRGMFVQRKFDSLNIGFHYDQGVLYFDTLHGTILDGCRLVGYGLMDIGSSPPGYHLTARVDSFNLDHLVTGSFSSDLSGRVELGGRGLSSATMIIDLGLDLEESFFDIYHCHSAAGEMTVTRDGLQFFPGFAVTYYDNRFVFDGSLAYGGEVKVSGEAELPDLTHFVHQTFIDLPAGRGKAGFTFNGPIKDPNLSGWFQSDSVWLNGFYARSFETEFDLASFMRSRRGPVTVTARRGDIWTFPYDSLWADMRLDSNLLSIDSAYVANSFSENRGRGLLDYLAYPQVLTLDSLTLAPKTGLPFISDGRQQIRIDSAGFIFDRMLLHATDGYIGFDGRADYDRNLGINWDIGNIAIAPWVALFKDSLGILGTLSSKGRVDGTLDIPAFKTELALDSLRYGSLLLGDMRAFLTYRDSTLTIDSSHLTSPEGEYTAVGDFPINLNRPGSGQKLFDEREQHIKIGAADKRLDLAAFFLTTVEYITGDFSAEIDLTGQPLKPHLNGRATLQNGVIKLVDLRDRVEQVDVELTMADELITLTRAEAMMPYKKGRSPGRISGSGTIRVNDIRSFTYGLALDCTGLPVNYEMGDFTGMADARLKVTGVTPPKVTGTIEMPFAYYRENFTEAESGFSLLTALEGDKTWDLDLMLECPSGFWVKNSDIDAEFSGSINILRTAGTYNFLGTLEVIRGKYFLFDKVFQITEGGQITYDNIELPDPKLNLAITTRIRSQNRYNDFQSEASYTYDLDLQITGTLNNPIISGSGGAVSTEDILPALLTNYRPSDIDSLGGGDRVTQRLTIGSVGMLASQVSRFGTRSLGVETFEIDPGLGKGFDPLATRLTIGAYTLPNLYVFGSSTFNLDRGQEVGAEFRLGRHYLFEGRRDEDNLYHLNFKLQWEY